MSEHESGVPSVTHAHKSSSLGGCGVFLWIVLLGLPLVMLGGFFLSKLDDTKTITMRGQVTLYAQSAQQVSCESVDRLRIVPQSEQAVDVLLVLDQRPSSGGGCLFRFTQRGLPVADEYSFEIAGFRPVAQRHSVLDTIGESGQTELEVRLSW